MGTRRKEKIRTIIWGAGFSPRGASAPLVALALAILLTYSNHFFNAFQFDDHQTILAHESVRWSPVVSASFAIDYALGGPHPFFFHLSTFALFLLQIVLMVFLFQRLTGSRWAALFAAAIYGLHPVNAETINYISQRGDLYNALGVVASLLLFIAWPGQRKRGWYLIPAIAACLSKPPALIFPFLLLAYVWLFEDKRAIRQTIPAFAVTAMAAIVTAIMTPSNVTPGAASGWQYGITQPWVALRYFRCFFLPTDLTADTDWTYIAPFSLAAIAGYLFIAAAIAAIVYTSRRDETKPIAFGVTWFLLALAPTSLVPLAEVTADYRMFFPFVGLALAVVWSAKLLIEPLALKPLAQAFLPVCLVLLAALATYHRNSIWHTEESLWRDVTLKSPENPRGHLNYANLLMARGDSADALPHLQRAISLKPDDATAEVRAAIACSALGRDSEAEPHYQRAIRIAPNESQPHFYYARWLESKAHLSEAQSELVAAISADQRGFAARYLLMQIYREQRDWPSLDALIANTQQLVRDEEVARGYASPIVRRDPAELPAPDTLIAAASKACELQRYDQCLVSARQALAIRPNSAEAYYIASGALLARGRTADAVHALRMALRIKPDYDAARNALLEAQ